MSRFDYPDPGIDPDYCNGLSDPPVEPYGCAMCGQIVSDDEKFFPYCSAECVSAAERDNTERGAA